MADLTDIQGQLLAFLRAYRGEDGTLDAQTDLIRTGWLDSLLLVDLVLHIERCFGVVLAAQDVTPAHFRTVASLAEWVRWHLDSQLRKAA